MADDKDKSKNPFKDSAENAVYPNSPNDALNLTSAFDNLVKTIERGLHVACPVVVVGSNMNDSDDPRDGVTVNFSNGELDDIVSVRPLVSYEYLDEDGKVVDLRNVTFSVHRQHPSHGGFTLMTPIRDGMLGWVISSDYDTNYLLNYSHVSRSGVTGNRTKSSLNEYGFNPDSCFKHLFSNGVFIPDCLGRLNVGNWNNLVPERIEDRGLDVEKDGSLYIGKAYPLSNREKDRIRRDETMFLRMKDGDILLFARGRYTTYGSFLTPFNNSWREGSETKPDEETVLPAEEHESDPEPREPEPPPKYHTKTWTESVVRLNGGSIHMSHLRFVDTYWHGIEDHSDKFNVTGCDVRIGKKNDGEGDESPWEIKFDEINKDVDHITDYFGESSDGIGEGDYDEDIISESDLGDDDEIVTEDEPKYNIENNAKEEFDGLRSTTIRPSAKGVIEYSHCDYGTAYTMSDLKENDKIFGKVTNISISSKGFEIGTEIGVTKRSTFDYKKRYSTPLEMFINPIAGRSHVQHVRTDTVISGGGFKTDTSERFPDHDRESPNGVKIRTRQQKMSIGLSGRPSIDYTSKNLYDDRQYVIRLDGSNLECENLEVVCHNTFYNKNKDGAWVGTPSGKLTVNASVISSSVNYTGIGSNGETSLNGSVSCPGYCHCDGHCQDD